VLIIVKSPVLWSSAAAIAQSGSSSTGGVADEDQVVVRNPWRCRRRAAGAAEAEAVALDPHAGGVVRLDARGLGRLAVDDDADEQVAQAARLAGRSIA
jgi:hypothetical protein